jgi:hypothetical protein
MLINDYRINWTDAIYIGQNNTNERNVPRMGNIYHMCKRPSNLPRRTENGGDLATLLIADGKCSIDEMPVSAGLPRYLSLLKIQPYNE